MVGVQPEGVDVRSGVRHGGRGPGAQRIWLLVVALLIALISAPAEGQAKPDEIQLTILDVGYNSAYRNGTWVPVDVIVENEKSDVSGYLEIRTYAAAGPVQSPVYRVPIESPNHSRKRFRVHCQLNDTMRVEAMVYHKGRRVVEVPSWVNVMPIRPTDSLIMIMDEISGNFTFLYNVLQDSTGDRKVYRHELSTEELSQLPGYSSCYGAFDLIVMSEIDPGRISVRHRELLRDYVQSGGVLVACVGESASAYRGSWVEELLGVRIGETQLVTEPEYAPLVLPPGSEAKANASRQYSVALMEPAQDGVVVFGEQLVLATMRKIGSGSAIGLAVDGPSKALQDTDGYRALWRELASKRQARRTLNYGQAAQAVVQQLPWISGVRIQPKSTVMAYLGLYFVVGIVGNWLFWNRMKRREMAWVCLVILSIGFTTYAVTFGTLGRAKNSEISYVDIIEVPLDAETGDLHTLAGVLTAGTAYYAGTLASEYALATEATALDIQNMYGGRPRGYAEFSPFTLIEGSLSRVEDMRVGASELRLLHIEHQVPVSGGVEGTLTQSDTGLQGDLLNKTGLRIDSAYLYYMGRFHRMNATADGWRVDLSNASMEGMQIDVFEQVLEQVRNNGGSWYGYGETHPENQRTRLLTALAMAPAMGGVPTLDATLGPFVIGWANGASMQSILMDEPIPERLHETLVIADVELRESEMARGLAVPLQVQVTGQTIYSQRQSSNQTYALTPGTNADLYIQLPVTGVNRFDRYGPISIEVTWAGPSSALSMYLHPGDSGKREEIPGTPKTVTRNGESVKQMVYTLADWQRLAAVRGAQGVQGQIMVSLFASSARGNAHQEVGEFTVRASVQRRGIDTSGGNWKSWPLSKPSS